MESGEQGGNDKRKKGVADDADRLEEGAAKGLVRKNFFYRGRDGNSHAPPQQLYLQSNDSLRNPDSRKHAAEDERSLVIAGIQAEQERQQ